MTHTLQRRAFLAATAAALPVLTLSTTQARAFAPTDHSDFENNMDKAGDALKAMRSPMRDLDNDDARHEAAMLANTVTIALAQCVKFAHQAPIPVRSESKYDGDTDRFATDLRIKLTEAVSAANALSRQLLMGNTEEAQNLYASLRQARKEGHDEFEEED